MIEWIENWSSESRKDVELSSLSRKCSQPWLHHAGRNSAGAYYGGWGEPMCCPQGETLQEVEESKRRIWPSWCHCHSLSLAPVNTDKFYFPGFTFMVPAHPGSPRQSPADHKTIVVVVVKYKLQEMYFKYGFQLLLFQLLNNTDNTKTNKDNQEVCWSDRMQVSQYAQDIIKIDWKSTIFMQFYYNFSLV